MVNEDKHKIRQKSVLMSDLCSVQSKVKQTVDGEPEWMGCSTAPVVCRRQEHQQ